VRLARGGIREHDASLGHEMKGPAGTGRGGISMAGGWEGQGARKGNGVRGQKQEEKERKSEGWGKGQKERGRGMGSDG